MNKESLFVIWWSHYGEGLHMESARKAFYGGMDAHLIDRPIASKPAIYPILEEVNDGGDIVKLMKDEMGVNIEVNQE